MAAPAQQQSQGDNSLGPLWIVIGLFILGWLTWSFGHTQISSFILKLRLLELQLIGLFTDNAMHIATTIKNTSVADVSFEQLSDISEQVGNFLRFPAAVIVIILALVIYFGHANLRFKKIHDMQTLLNEEKISWPQITPVSDLDLVNTDIDQGPWAMSLSPMQFAKKHQLLQLERILPSEAFSSQQAKIVATVRQEEAHRIFALQLGRYWSGIEKLNIHTKALFAVFAARISHDRDGATKLLLQIAGSAASGKLNFSGVDELLNKHKNSKLVTKAMQNHAFVLTVMATMLQYARNDGVLASADFLWLKPVDRNLWFMLNSVGRQVPFSEVAGPFAHWIAERLVGHKLNVPMVEEAVKGLEVAIKNIVYVPDDEG